tara:strand:+ start:3253 stop:3495 length:243 start_codon:yes stop_codon:yes gene_type:complete
MADTFTKIPDAVLEAEDAPEDSWKAIHVKKEHQPATVESILSYGLMEIQVAEINAQIVSLEESKTAIEAEMAKVKAAVEA